MKREETIVKNNFFKKIWYSITKFEKYPEMAAEGIQRALKYLIILSLIVALTIMIGLTLEMKDVIQQLANYIDQSIPNFVYENEKLTMEIDEPLFIEDVKYIAIDRIIINPILETDEEKENFEKENQKNGTTMFLFNDKIVLSSKSENDSTARQAYTYKEFIAGYTPEDIQTFDKAKLVEYLKSENMISFYTRYSVSTLVYAMITNTIITLYYCLIIAILGWVTTKIARIKIKFEKIYSLSTYALTLSIILNIIYIVINYFIDFTINYFQVAYITIAYIYMAAIIFIIKDDLIKKMQEVEEIKKEQEKVREEIEMQEENQKKNKEEQKKKEKKEKDEKKKEDQGEEPEGSGA